MKRSFLKQLLDAPGPSGFEVRPARVWRAEAETFADQVTIDVHGNSMAALQPDRRPRVMMAGHVDEIGLQITHIDDDGFLYIDEIGGWDPQVLVGQRVKILGREGDLPGVIGKKAIHLMDADDRSKASKTKQLWVDVGVSSRDEAVEMGLRVGDPMVLAQSMIELAGDRIASRAIDNRIGAFVVLEALRMLSEDPAPAAGAFAVATTQEEIGYQGGGARSSAFSIEPDVALVVDVTFSTDVPDVPKKELGDHKVGGGPVLSRGSAAHSLVFERLAEVAEAEGIPYSIQASPRATRTDADGIHLTRAGVPTGLVSVPNRYMHSPNEVVSMSDLENTARLLAAFVRTLGDDTDFTPR
ncbi:M42 family metallopeptidase [Gaopeijia maritima]|uniref:M42 family metallopeptidase n=1 Tax=Gaopeijia maritima TaxID=3119007 RepID=A0ABU9E4Z5_9BACT